MLSLIGRQPIATCLTTYPLVQVQSPQGSWIEHYMSPGASPVHQQIKQEEVQFTCPVQGCAATFNNAQILCRHATDKHFVERFARELPQAPPFACPMCGHQAPDQMSLIRHWGIAHKMVIKMFNEQVGRPNCFDTSILSKFEIRGVRENCPLCKGAFQGRQLLMRHLSDTHFKDRMCNGIPDQEGLIYKCPQCNHVARDRQSFVRHYGIVHKMVVKYLNEMGIHTLDDENVRSAPQSPATTPRQYHDQSFSPRGYNEPMGSPGYGYSPHQTPQRSPAYHGQEHYSPAYTSSAYTSPQYMGQSPRNNIGSPQDYPGRPAQPSYPPYGSAPQSPMYGQAQDLSASKPQDLSMAGHPQDLTKPSQPVDYSAAQPGYQGQQFPARPAPAQVQQKPLHVMVNDPYRQPSTPGLPMTPSSQHSNPGTPQPQQLSQPGTPQPPSVPSPASYRQPATPGAYTQEYAAPSPAPVQQRVIVQQPQPVTTVKKPTDYMPQGDDHIQPPEPGTRGPYGIYCIHCSAVKARQPSDFYRHLAETHYKNYLAQYLPAPGNPPYRCPLCPYENKEMSPMIRHYGVAHKKVKEAIGNEVVGKYIPEAEMAPCRPAKNSYGVMPQTPEPQPVYEQPVQRHPVVVSPPSPPPAHVSVKCPYPDCEMEFTARYAFWQHMCDKHLKDDLLKFIPASPSQPYQCPYENCNYVTKDSRQALVRHYGMTHKVVQGLLAEHYPEFLTTDKFQQPVKPVRPRAKSMTPIYAGAQYSGGGSQPLAPPAQPYIQHQGQPHLQQVVQPQTQYYQQAQAGGNQHYTTQQSTQHLSYTQQQQPQEQYDSLNLDNLNPSDFSIPSLSEFLDNPGASFPNLSGADLTNTGYVTAAGHALPHSHMQFEPQMDGTFDPTSITDQSLDGSAGSNPTTPEKNKATLSPAGETSQRKPPPPLKKYCEICGKEYEGKNKSMNKVQHMIHHFKDKLYQNLPPKSEDGLPYKCPEEGCKFETKHKPDWARHYGSVHKVVDRLLAAYLEDHPEAWALQPENKELLREQSPSGQSSSHGHGQSSSSQRPASTAGSAAGSEHLDAGEGLLCKLADLQAKGMQGTSGVAGPSPSPAPSRPSPGPSPVVTSVAQGGRLAVEFPKSDLTRFITSALTEKNVPHAAPTTTIMAPVATSPINLSPQQMLEQKVQSVINEQQQILNSQKASMGPVKTETVTTVSCGPVMSPRPGTVLAGPEALQGSSSSQTSAASTPVATPSNTPQPSPAQPVSIAGPSGPVKTAESLKHMEARQAIQQLLQGQQTKQILIKDPKTGQQHLVVQGQGGQQFLLQKAPPGQGQQLVLHGKDGQRQLVQVQAAPSQQGRQVIIQTSSGPQQVTLQGAQGAQQQVTLQGPQGAQQQVTLQGAHGPQQQVTLQTSQGPQTVTLNSSVGQQQLQVIPQQPRLQAGTKLVQVEEPSPRAQPQASPQPGPSGSGGAIPNQVVSGQGAAAGQQIIQSKIVQHNGRTYLVQVRAQKPIEPGKQIVIKTNQPGVGGPGLVQEVMDEVLRQEYQKAELQKQEQQKQEQQKISELAMQLQGSVQEHLEMVQQSPKKPQPPKPLAAGTKLTLQQQQLLLPTEPHPQIAAQHQAKQQQLRRQQAGMAARPTSILQQQLELPVNSGPSIKLSPPKPQQASKPSSPVQCFLCQEMPWFPNQEHLDNHYSTAHGIMKPAETDTEMDIPAFSNADLEASLSSMTDLKDDGGDFESLLDALPPSPEPEEALDCTPGTSSGSVIRRKSTFVVTGQGTSTTRMCEICGFEPKTKNKSRERMDHLAMKHFRDQMISELRKDKPMKCPRCDIFESKDRQQLFRHMISKHKVLDGYLTEAVERMKAEGKTPFLSGHLDSGVSANPDEAPGSVSEEQAAMEAAEAEADKKPDKIMQVDGWADSESDDSDVEMEQLDGAVEGSDSESGTGMVDSESGTGMDADSEFSVEDHLAQEGGVRKGLKLPCPICKEDMKFSRTYHFATSHFRPRLAAILPPAKPFICPDCGEEQMHKMNLWSHYIGRAHKHLDTWLNEYLQAEVKPDWCDPSPPSSRKSRKSSSGLLHSTGSAPSSPLTTPKKLPFSGASTPERGSPAAKEWFCDLCHGLVPQRRETHYASLHFKEKLKTILPVSMPFVCPDCQAEHKHFLNLSTHYLTQHGYLKTWLEEKGIQYEPNRKGRSLATRVLVPGANAGESVEAGEVPQSSQERSSSSKHCLSSSESDEAGEEEEGREYLVMRPVTRTALQEALVFLTQDTKEVIATDIKQEIKNEPQDTTQEITADEKTAEEPSEEKPVAELDIKIEPAATLEANVEPEKEVAEVRKVKRKRVKRSLEYNLDEVLSSLLGRATSGDPEPWAAEPPPVQVMTTVALPDNPPPHTWLCDGRLLVLQENLDQRNIKIFQEQWRRGQPVIVANVSNNLDINLWSPKAFNAQFGMLKHNIINCKTHKMIPKVPLKWFWDGFESLNSRMMDKHGMPMLLKLKDWPPEEDFKLYFPNRFKDLMKWLPLGDYTKREGTYNLARYIPDFCVRPDLGPKMYIAYGSPLYPECGSTNLHLDMSDAVNLIVYVGIPTDGNKNDLFEEGLKAVDEAGCDLATKKRVRESGVLVGALWHIFHHRDADKIRDFLNKVSIEKGHKLEPHNDPIHDQSVYLDGALRQRLFKEYGVVGYAIPQCEGDTIFIPAGAPHQVHTRKIRLCIHKVVFEP